jgi:Yip1 domain
VLRRALRLIVSPAREWEAVAAAELPSGKVLLGYVVPLSAVPAVAWMIGLAIFGADLGFRDEDVVPLTLTLGRTLYSGAVTLAGSVLSVLALAAAFYLVAPMYATPRHWRRALAVAAYGTTPLWVAGVLLVKPGLVIVGLVAFLHCCHRYYAGLQRVAGVKRGDAAEYVAISLFLVTIASLVVGGAIGSLALI